MAACLGADRFRLWRYSIGAAEAALVELPFDNDIDRFAMYAQGRVAVIGYRSALRGLTEVFVDGFTVPADFGLPRAAIAGSCTTPTGAAAKTAAARLRRLASGEERDRSGRKEGIGRTGARTPMPTCSDA